MNNLRTIKARHANGDIEECSVRIERHPHKIFFSGAGFQEREFSSGDLFEALILLRRELERMNIQLLCNGARRDVFPSRMCRDMGHGGRAYIMKMGCYARSTDLVDIFDYSDGPSLGSVAEQQDFYKKWSESLQNEKSIYSDPFDYSTSFNPMDIRRNAMKIYEAVIWDKERRIPVRYLQIRAEDRDDAEKKFEAEQGVQRTSVFAKDLDEAKKKLEAEYGAENVFSLYNEEDHKR